MIYNKTLFNIKLFSSWIFWLECFFLNHLFCKIKLLKRNIRGFLGLKKILLVRKTSFERGSINQLVEGRREVEEVCTPFFFFSRKWTISLKSDPRNRSTFLLLFLSIIRQRSRIFFSLWSKWRTRLQKELIDWQRGNCFIVSNDDVIFRWYLKISLTRI